MCKQIRNKYKIKEKATSPSLSEQQWIVNEAWMLSFQYISLFCIYSSTRKEKITEREREWEKKKTNLVATAEVVGVDRCNWWWELTVKRLFESRDCHFSIRREKLEWIVVVMKRHSFAQNYGLFWVLVAIHISFLGPSFYCLFR